MTTGHQVALWAAVAAFFSTILATAAFDIFDVHGWAKFLSAVFVALVTAGAVYSKQRLDDAKAERPAPRPKVPV